MPVVARRITSTGSLYLSNTIDEVSTTTIRLTTDTFYVSEFDEVSLVTSPAYRESSTGIVYTSGELLEQSIQYHISNPPLATLPANVEAWSTIPGYGSGATYIFWYAAGNWQTDPAAGTIYFTGQGGGTPQSGTWKTGNTDASLYEIRWSLISGYSPMNGNSIMKNNPDTWLSMNQFLDLGTSVVGGPSAFTYTEVKFDIRNAVTGEILATMPRCYLRAVGGN